MESGDEGGTPSQLAATDKTRALTDTEKESVRLRGAMLAFSSVFKSSTTITRDKAPQFWQLFLQHCTATSPPALSFLLCLQCFSVEALKEGLKGLGVAPSELLHAVVTGLRSTATQVVWAAATAYAALAKALPELCLSFLLRQLYAEEKGALGCQGALRGLLVIIECHDGLGITSRLLDIVGLFIGFVIPLLTHSQQQIRGLAARGFSGLMKVFPAAQQSCDAVPQWLAPASHAESEELRCALRRGNDVLQVLRQRDKSMANPFAQPRYESWKPKATLRPYQVEGIEWLRFLQLSGLHGVLGDDIHFTVFCVLAIARHLPLRSSSGYLNLRCVFTDGTGKNAASIMCHSVQRCRWQSRCGG